MLNTAVIGASRIGHVHAETIAVHPGATLTLVTDPFGDATQRLAEVCGARHAADVDSVFTNESVDAVIVDSPTPLHIPHLLAVAKAGKAVLCEKPITLDMKDAGAAHDELDTMSMPIMFGFDRRFDPSFATVRAQLEGGTIDSLGNLLIISRDPSAPPAEYVEVSGGISRDITIHDFDMARFFLGDIIGVHTFGQNFNEEVRETGDFGAAVVTLENAASVVATVVNNRECSAGYDQRLEAQGSAGTLSADNIRTTTVRLSNAEVTGAAESYLDFFPRRYADAYRPELTTSIDAIVTGTKPAPSTDDAIEALHLVEAATESAKTGKLVSFAQQRLESPGGAPPPGITLSKQFNGIEQDSDIGTTRRCLQPRLIGKLQ